MSFILTAVIWGWIDREYDWVSERVGEPDLRIREGPLDGGERDGTPSPVVKQGNVQVSARKTFHGVGVGDRRGLQRKTKKTHQHPNTLSFSLLYIILHFFFIFKVISS